MIIVCCSCLINFEDRHKDLVFDYQQEFGNIVQEKLESREVNQSVLQLGYSFPTRYGDKDYFALLVFNGLLVGLPIHVCLQKFVKRRAGIYYRKPL